MANILSTLFGKRRTSPVANSEIAPEDAAAAPTRGAITILKSYGLTGYDFGDADAANGRVWFADGEDLAEGGIKGWLTELAPYLSAQGAPIGDIEDVEFGDNYRLSVNGRQVTIYEDVGPDCWHLAAIAAARIVNWLLETANSPERCYMLYTGGNEGIALFIRVKTCQRLLAEPDLDLRDRPEDFGSLDNPIDADGQA